MRPNFEGAHLWMGEREDGSGVQTAAALRWARHVAEELKKEAAIDKERRRRKAREVKDAARDARAKVKASPQEPPGK
eukprot:5265129-Amphidinium_carterae.1